MGVCERFFPARGAAPAVRDSPAEGVAAGVGDVRIRAAEPVAVAVDFGRRSGVGVAHLLAAAVAHSYDAHRPGASQPRRDAAEHLRRERAAPQGQQPASFGGVSSSPPVRRNHQHDPVPVQRIIPRFYHPEQVPCPPRLISYSTILIFSNLTISGFHRL